MAIAGSYGKKKRKRKKGEKGRKRKGEKKEGKERTVHKEFIYITAHSEQGRGHAAGEAPEGGRCRSRPVTWSTPEYEGSGVNFYAFAFCVAGNLRILNLAGFRKFDGLRPLDQEGQKIYI